MVRRRKGRAAASTRVWPALLVLAIVGLVSYRNIFACPFVFDSEFRILDNWTIRRLWPPWDWLTYSQRPVAYFTFALNYAAGGYDVLGYHLVNVAIHLAAASVLFLIVRTTLQLPAVPQRYRQSAAGLALSVALLWLAHPLQTQAVTYTVQRIESLMGLLFLLTLYLFQRTQIAPRALPWYVASVVCCWLGAATKEVMAMAPLVVLWYDRAFIADSWRQIWVTRRTYYGCLCASWVFLALLITQMGNYQQAAVSVEGLTPIGYALSQPGVLVHYLRLCVWPTGQCLDYGWPPATTVGDVLPYALVIVGLLAATVWCVFKSPQLSFLGAWFFLILAPTSTIMPIRDLAFEHRMYLPLAAVAACLVFAVFERCQRIVPTQAKAVATSLVVIVTVALASLTYLRNQDYATVETVWRDVVDKAPHNPRGHNNLGVQLFARGELDQARDSFQTALELDPNYVDAMTNLGSVLVEQQQVEKAIEQWQQALAIDPEYVNAHYNLGKALRGLGRTSEAMEQFRKALEIDPHHTKSHNDLGTALAEAGQTDEAIRHFETALQIDPAAAKTHYNLATAHQFGRGDMNQAISHYRAAIAIDANYAAAHSSLGIALFAANQFSEAVQHLQQALAIDPNDRRARLGLANWNYNVGQQSVAENNPAQAEQHFRTAISLMPEFAEAHLSLGQLLAAQARRADAISHLQEAIRLNPQLNEAREILKTLAP